MLQICSLQHVQTRANNVLEGVWFSRNSTVQSYVIGGLRVINKIFACIRETNLTKHYQGSKLALANLLKTYIPV